MWFIIHFQERALYGNSQTFCQTDVAFFPIDFFSPLWKTNKINMFARGIYFAAKKTV